MRSLFLSCFAFLIFAASARADNAPALAGFEGGTPFSGRNAGLSSPVAAEMDGNFANGLEIAAGGMDGILYVYASNGSLLWKYSLPNAACSGGSKASKLMSSPAVGAIYGDGVPYLVVGYGGLGSLDCDGGVVALRGSDGTLAWHFSIKTFSKKNKYWAFRYSVASTPALADTDGDGRMEIGFGSFDRNVFLLNANGSVRWYYNAADTVWSSPAFANIDGDPQLEMVIGTDISQNKRMKPPIKNGGYVYAFDTAARKPTHLSFRQKGAYLWQRHFDQVIFSAPSVGDVLPGSPGPEVVVQSGCFFSKGNDKPGKWVKVLRARDGKVLMTLPTSACSSSSPALADIDGDGQLEILATVNGLTSYGGDGTARIYAWKLPNRLPMWTAVPRVMGDNDDRLGDTKSPVVADIDGNGSLEVLVSNSSGISIHDALSGAALSCQASPCDGLLLLRTGATIQSSPAVADANLDGQLDVFAAGSGLYAWTAFSGLLGSAPGASPAFSRPWPMYRGNAQRSGSAN